MAFRPRTRVLVIVLVTLGLVAWVALNQVVKMGAGGLLHPARTITRQARPEGCEDKTFRGVDVTLKGWRCLASGTPRGTVVYLHGIADNRGSAAGAIQRFTALGFDVIAYDSRSHGESGGTTCTYGYFEKSDLRRVLDTIEHAPIYLLGTSLGAAVALQAASEDRRIAGVVAAEVFSDLRTVATERAPRIFTKGLIERAFAEAERQAGFNVDNVSAVGAAERIGVPVLLIHGAEDRDTPPNHSRRVYAALTGPKRLILVEGAGHNQSLSRDSTWKEIEAWIIGQGQPQQTVQR